MFGHYLSIGQQDQSRYLIKQIKVIFQGQILLITIKTPNEQIYQGELRASQSEFSLQQMKEYLEGVECHSVVQQHETLKFICYDVPFELKNREIMIFDDMKSRKQQLQEQIQHLQLQLLLKNQELQDLDYKIKELQNQLKMKKQSFGIKMKIDERKELRINKEKQLVGLLKSNLTFPNLQTVDFWINRITNAGLKALAENGHKFPNLQKVNFRFKQITDSGLKVLAENAHKFPNLQTVFLGKNQITPKDKEQILSKYNFKFKIRT